MDYHLRDNDPDEHGPDAPHFADVSLPPLLHGEFDPGWDLGTAAQHIVLMHFTEVLRRRQGVWRNDDVEHVHQIRVAARRCRTALQTFAALWPEREARKFTDYLAAFATRFNEARDLDVLILWLEERLASADGDRATAYRWLLARSQERRAVEQPKLERALVKLEDDGFAAAFVAYFSRLPFDLWELGKSDEAVSTEQEDG